MANKRAGKNAASRSRVTLRDIAAECEVSPITVSYALRGGAGHVAAATVERVCGVARQLGYDQSAAHAARRLRYQGRPEKVVNHVAALFYPCNEVHSPYWACIFEGIQLELGAARFGTLTCSLNRGGPHWGDQLPLAFRRGDVDGAILYPTEFDREDLIAALRDEPGFDGRPIVALLESFEGCSAVMVDEVEVGRLAAGHLLDHGHRRLLGFASERYTSPIIRKRIEGYRKAFAERGIDSEASLILAPWIWECSQELPDQLAQLFEQHPGITGILCPNDMSGVELAQAMRNLGLEIPRDYSVVGVDDTHVWMDENGNNIWTSVRLPLRELGRTAAKLLLDRISGDEPAERTVILPVSLVDRGGTRTLHIPAKPDIASGKKRR